MEASRAAPAFTAATRLLVIAPHPDDETIATGILIQQVLAAGGAVRIVLLTAGDNNPWPQRWLEKRWRIDAAGRQRWGQRRQAELFEALHRLGVSQDALQPMGWPDMGVTDRLMHHTARSLAAITVAIEQFKPSVVAMPSIEDRHPDHGAAHVLVRLALAGMPESPQLIGYLIHGHQTRDHTRHAHAMELQSSDAQSARKAEALHAHHTQMALSGARLHRLAMGAERHIAVASRAAGSPYPLPWQPPIWLRPWLRVSLVSRQGAQSWRWRDAPLRRGDDGSYRLDATASGMPEPRFVKLACAGHSPWIFDRWGWCEA